MIDTTILARDVDDPRVIEALQSVPRHLFVPGYLKDQAYDDTPLPIGYRQTISQPYIVALMSAALELDFTGERPPRVLEIGTGSGYQAAVLDAMGADVWSVEIVEELAERSAALLERLGYDRVRVRAGDGYRGWPEQAPFDAIIVTAAPPEIPEPLLEQLRDGAHLVIPVGDYSQELLRITRRGDTFTSEHLAPVTFVPMTGEAQGH